MGLLCRRGENAKGKEGEGERKRWPLVEFQDWIIHRFVFRVNNYRDSYTWTLG